MNRQNIITSALNILKEELQVKNELVISIVHLGFMDHFNELQVSAEFASLRADDYDEGFYFNVQDENYYYYGEALYDNPGSFSNKYGFMLGTDELKLLPDSLKTILKRVGQTKIAERMRVNALI